MAPRAQRLHDFVCCYIVMSKLLCLKNIGMRFVHCQYSPTPCVSLCEYLKYCNVANRLIIDKPERRLKKGSGFHMDIVIMSLVNALCGMFGAPWQCVATVRSVSHVSALTVMSTTHAPGDKPYIVEVKGTHQTHHASDFL